MRVLLTAFLLGVLLVATAGSAASVPGPTAPLAAIAFVEAPQGDNPGTAYLAWTPAAVTPDSYAIYGVVNGTLTSSPIATESAMTTATTLSEIYSGYAVAAITDGVASAPTLAVTLVEACVQIGLGVPPDFAIGCMPASGLPAHVELMVNGRNLVS